jgi:hypothetical protein
MERAKRDNWFRIETESKLDLEICLSFSLIHIDNSCFLLYNIIRVVEGKFYLFTFCEFPRQAGRCELFSSD